MPNTFWGSCDSNVERMDDRLAFRFMVPSINNDCDSTSLVLFLFSPLLVFEEVVDDEKRPPMKEDELPPKPVDDEEAGGCCNMLPNEDIMSSGIYLMIAFKLFL